MTSEGGPFFPRWIAKAACLAFGVAMIAGLFTAKVDSKYAAVMMWLTACYVEITKKEKP